MTGTTFLQTTEDPTELATIHELAEMKEERISPAEGRKQVVYKPFIFVMSSLAAGFSLNVACFLI